MGLLLCGVYFLLLPPLLARTTLRKLRTHLGFWRFYLMAFLLLYMLSLPIKMYLYWLFGIQSVIG